MTEYVTGQIYGWNGGECTMHPKTVVRVWLRGGAVDGAMVQTLVWGHNQSGFDIVCFQVIEPYAEPNAIWVNVYDNGSVNAFCSKEKAEWWRDSSCTRIAVEYVEKQK